MNIIRNYNEYLHRKTKENYHRCECECDAKYIISRTNITENFGILYLEPENVRIYECHINNNNGFSFHINQINETCRHSLRKVIEGSNYTSVTNEQWNQIYHFDGNQYGYDEYYEKFVPSGKVNEELNNAIENISVSERCRSIYIKGAYTECTPVMYALQQKFGTDKKISLIESYDTNEITKIDKLKIRSSFPEIIKDKIHLNIEATPANFLKKDEYIHVPVCDETLDSPFFGRFSWRDILPSDAKEETDARMGNVHFKLITLEFQIDAFRNIFLTTKECLNNKQKRTLIYNAQSGNNNLIAYDSTQTHTKKHDTTTTVTTDKPHHTQSTNRPETNVGNTPTKQNKTYIIDTNIFIDDPYIIDKIDKKDNIIIPLKVVDELDKLKTKEGKIKENAEKALSNIQSKIRKESRSITIDNTDTTLLPPDLSKKSPDNIIVAVALKYKDESPIIMTSDNGLFLKIISFKTIKTISYNDFINRHNERP